MNIINRLPHPYPGPLRHYNWAHPLFRPLLLVRRLTARRLAVQLDKAIHINFGESNKDHGRTVKCVVILHHIWIAGISDSR